MSTTAAFTPGARVVHRSWGHGTVKPSPTAGGVAARVQFDSGHTVMVRVADLEPEPSTLREAADAAHEHGLDVPAAVQAAVDTARRTRARG